MGDKKVREPDGLVGRGMECESNEKEILVERDTMQLWRNLVLENSQESARMTTAKTSSNNGEGA